MQSKKGKNETRTKTLCMEIHVWMEFNWWYDCITLPSSSQIVSYALHLQSYRYIGMQWNESNGHCSTIVVAIAIADAVAVTIVVVIINKLWIDGRKLVLQQSWNIKMQITFASHLHLSINMSRKTENECVVTANLHKLHTVEKRRVKFSIIYHANSSSSMWEWLSFSLRIAYCCHLTHSMYLYVHMCTCLYLNSFVCICVLETDTT